MALIARSEPAAGDEPRPTGRDKRALVAHRTGMAAGEGQPRGDAGRDDAIEDQVFGAAIPGEPPGCAAAGAPKSAGAGPPDFR